MIESLRQLFTAPENARAGSQIIARDGAGNRTWAYLCARIRAWETALASVDGNLVALYERDSLEFMAALAALWRLGKQALVPANNLPASCAQLAALTPHFAGDFPLDSVLVAAPASENHASLALWSIPAADTCALVLFTSGSTGNPEPVAKSFAQLEAELAALESQWGAQLDGATITSSVSHHHIYGLLFRLLWPLCAGRPFLVRERDYWEELADDAHTYQPLAIISSPAHLSRIPPLDWPIPAQLVALFSSGAPLATAASLAAKTQLGHAVTEVYGSTETGGIGWREQDNGSDWTCLPGVQIALDDSVSGSDSLLQVRSAHLADDNWYTSADRASLTADGCFSLCGRADRIAKVGGKRISLSAIERVLEAQEGVVQARVILLPERGERLGAVVILDNAGNKRLVDQGKAGISQQLKRALENTVDRVAIPRYWRFLGELPRNRQGKSTHAELAQLFSSNELPRLPEVVASSEEGDALLLNLFIPANLYYFDGHFPGRPVLPGVVQTHWAVHYGRAHWGDLGEFTDLEAVKFQQVVTANQTLLLRLEYQRDKGKLYFTYTSGSETAPIAHASGRVVFAKGQE